MDDILKLCIIFLSIGGITMVFIVVSYLFIVLINKKFGLDINGNKINKSKNVEPQVLRIETASVDNKEKIIEDKSLLSKKQEDIDDIPSFLKKKSSDLSVETSFNKNRIGKINN